jgi:hypothetical protein
MHYGHPLGQPGKHGLPAGHGQPAGSPGYQPGVFGLPVYPGPSSREYPAAPYDGKPPDYKGWAITTMVLGGLFNYVGLGLGGIALRRSRQVRRRWDAGDGAGALAASRAAWGWAISATILDEFGFLVVLIFLANLHIR